MCSPRDSPDKVPTKKVETDSYIFIPKQEVQSPLNGNLVKRANSRKRERSDSISSTKSSHICYTTGSFPHRTRCHRWCGKASRRKSPREFHSRRYIATRWPGWIKMRFRARSANPVSWLTQVGLSTSPSHFLTFGLPHLGTEPSSKEHQGQSVCGYLSPPGMYWQPPAHLEVSRG